MEAATCSPIRRSGHSKASPRCSPAGRCGGGSPSSARTASSRRRAPRTSASSFAIAPGSIPARIFREADQLGARFERGDAIEARGKVERFRGKLSAELTAVRRIEPGSYDPAEFLPSAYRSVEELEGFFEHLVGEIYDPALRTVVERVVGARAGRHGAAAGAVHAWRPPRLPRRPARAHGRRRHPGRRALPAPPAARLRPADGGGAPARHRQDARVHLRRRVRDQRGGRDARPPRDRRRDRRVVRRRPRALDGAWRCCTACSATTARRRPGVLAEARERAASPPRRRWRSRGSTRSKRASRAPWSRGSPSSRSAGGGCACARSGGASSRAAAREPRGPAGSGAGACAARGRRRDVPAGARARVARLRAWPRESWATAVTTRPEAGGDPLLLLRRERAGGAHVEDRLDPRGGLVRVLAAWASRAARPQLDLLERDRDPVAELEAVRSSRLLRSLRSRASSGGRAAARGTARAPRRRARAPAPGAGWRRRRRRRRRESRAGRSAGRRRSARCRSRCCRQVPTIATGTMISSEVASASTWAESRKIASAGTKSTPPPTPSRPPTAPPASPKAIASATSIRGSPARRRR